MTRPRSVLTTAAVAFACLCSGPALAHSASEVDVPAAWQYASPADATAPNPANGWWTIFHDGQLDDLVARMHAGSTTLAQASAKLDMARADARMAGASLSPQVAIDASASHASGPLVNEAGGSGNLFTARATVSWEADLAGRISSQRAASRLEASAAEALLRDTRLLLEARVADAYFRALEWRERSRIAAQILELESERSQIADRRRSLGLDSSIQRNDSERHLADAREMAANARLASESALRELAYQAGESSQPPLNDAPLVDLPEIPMGLPADMLARRPDISAARDHMLAADKRLQSEERAWLPAITLTASGGAASPSLGDILQSASRDFGLGLLLSLPILDGGRHRALVLQGKASARLAAAEYRDKLLSSLREVNDALGQVGNRREHAEESRLNLDRANAYSSAIAARATNGTASRSEFLAARIKSLQAEAEAAEARADALCEVVRLVAAMGGGWQKADKPTELRHSAAAGNQG